MSPISDNMSIQTILLVCEHACGVDNIAKRCRERDVVLGRQLAFKLLREHLKMSFKSISEVFGDAIKDHSTVIHGIRRINDLLDSGDILASEKFNTIMNDRRLLPYIRTYDQAVTVLIPEHIPKEEFFAYIQERYPDSEML
jgi:hypothetical protein